MSSPASIKSHPVHPMLVVFPIGLCGFALVCDMVHAVSGSAVWPTVATFCVAGGIVGALLAAVPGLIDYFSIDEAEMKRIANLHLGAWATSASSSYPAIRLERHAGARRYRGTATRTLESSIKDWARPWLGEATTA